MTVEKGDMVLVDYVGRTGGEIFDLTDEEVAEEKGVKSDSLDYQPIPVLVGENYVIEGFEEALEGMEIGEEKTIEVPSEKGYGERSSEKVETYPEKEFKKQGVNVRPGEEIMIGNQRGRVISTGSGRVRIDFNHPLAGKDLEYDIKVVEKVEDDEEIAENIYSYRVGHGDDAEFEDGTVKIPKAHSHGDHVHELPEQLREELKEEIEKYTDLEVEFTEPE